MNIMRALSVRQPWAWLIAHGHKPVENRSWPTSHRGDTLIHASKVFDVEGLDSVLKAFPDLKRALPQQYELGGIVGKVQLLGCVDSHASAWFTGPYGFVLYGARPLPFVPLRGELVGRSLACWCPLDAPCHADVLLKVAASGEAKE